MSIGALNIEVSAGIATFAGDMGKVAQIAENAMKRTEQAQKIATAASDKFIKSLQFQADTMNKTETEVLKYRASLLGASEAAAPLIANIEAMSKQAGSVKNVGDEFEHMGFKTAGAKRELLVLVHELSQGNFSRFGGSLLVLGERTGAAALLFSGLGVAALGAAAVLAGVIYLIYEGHKAFEELNNSLKSSHGAIGLTAQQLYGMSASFVESTKDIDNGRVALTALVASGKVTSTQLAGFGRAALDMAHDTGESIEEVVKELGKLSDGALKFAVKYDEAHHFMTAAQYRLIKSLDDEGHQAEAVKVVIESLQEAHKRMAADGLKQIGYLQQGMNNYMKEIHRVEEVLMSWGAGGDPNQDKMNNLLKTRAMYEKELNAAQKSNGSFVQGETKNIIAQIDAQIAATQKQIGVHNALTKANADGAKATDNAKRVDAYLDSGPKSDVRKHADERKKEDKEFQVAIAGLEKNSADYERVYKSHLEKLNVIDESYKKKGGKGIGAFNRASLDDIVKPINTEIAAQAKALQEREQVLAKYYKLDQISLADYIAKDKSARDNALKETLAGYDKEIAAINAYIGKTKDATERLKGETMKKGIVAQRANAIRDAGAKEELANEKGIKENQAYTDQVAKLNIQLLQLQGNFSEATRKQLEFQDRAAKKHFEVNGDVGARKMIDDIEKHAQAIGDIKEQTDAYSLAMEKEANIEGRIRLNQKLGTMGELEGLAATDAARKKTAESLSDVADEYDRIAQASGDPKLVANAEAFRLKVDEIAASAKELDKKFSAIADGAFSTFISDVATGTKSITKAFHDMESSVVASISKIAAQLAVQEIFGKGGSGGAASGIGSFFANLFSGSGGGIGTGSTSAVDSSAFSAMDAIAGARAGGGSVDYNAAYLVGEKGPEIFKPGASGTIVPNHALGGKGTTNITINVPQSTSRHTADQIAQMSGMAVQRALARNG